MVEQTYGKLDVFLVSLNLYGPCVVCCLFFVVATFLGSFVVVVLECE